MPLKGLHWAHWWMKEWNQKNFFSQRGKINPQHLWVMGTLKKKKKNSFLLLLYLRCCLVTVTSSFISPFAATSTLQWRWCVCTAWWWSLTFHLCGNSFLCGLFVTVVTCCLPNSPSVDSRQTYHYDWVIFHRSQITEWNCPSWQPSTLVTSYYFRCEYMKKKSR